MSESRAGLPWSWEADGDLDESEREQFVRYKCRSCKSMCINPRGSDAAEAGECRHCAFIVALEDVEVPEPGSGPIPPEVDWTDLVAYRCRLCKDHCLNYRESAPAEARQCRTCHPTRD